MFSKSICSIKEHWWSLALSWPDEIQRKFLTAHKLLNVKIDTRDEYMFFFIYTFYRYKTMIYCFNWFRDSTSRLLSLYIFIYDVILLFPHWALFSSRSLPFNPLQVCVRPHTSTWWIRRTFQIFELDNIWCIDIHWIVSSLCYDFDYPYLFWWSVYLIISMSCKVYVFF